MENKEISMIRDTDLDKVSGGKDSELVRYPMDEVCRKCSSENLNISHIGGGRFRIKCNDCGESYTIESH